MITAMEVTNGQQALFDYSAFDQETQIVIRMRATEIKTLAKRVAADIVEIGGKLVEVKDRIGPNGRFLEWLERELGWSERTAYNFMAVHEKFSAANFALENVAASALYLLAAPSTPPEAVKVAKQIADSGEEVTHRVAKEIVRQAKAKKQKEQPELVEEAEPEEEQEENAEPARTIEELVETVRKASGRITVNTLINQGFTQDQVREAEHTGKVERKAMNYLWYAEPKKLPSGWKLDEEVDEGYRAVNPEKNLRTLLFQTGREAVQAAHNIDKGASEGLVGIGGRSMAAPVKTTDQVKTEAATDEAFSKLKIEISLTLMPGDGNKTGRMIVGSVGAENCDRLFFSARGFEDFALIRLGDALEQFKRELPQRQKAKPVAKASPAKSAKKPAAKPAAKTGKPKPASASAKKSKGKK